MWRAAVLVLAACGGSSPSSSTAPTPVPDPDPPKAPPPSDAPIANVAPTPAPDPTPTTTPAPTPTTSPGGAPVARPCPRKTPILFTVTTDTQTHDQVCTIVDDYITFLGSPSLRAPDLALQFTVTVTNGSPVECKISVDVHLRTKLVLNADGGAKVALGPTNNVAAAREDCIRAVVNDQLGRTVVPSLVRAGVTGPSAPTSTGSGAGSSTSP